MDAKGPSSVVWTPHGLHNLADDRFTSRSRAIVSAFDLLSGNEDDKHII
jgi:hypothetical protein